jgi:hypothetical protein
MAERATPMSICKWHIKWQDKVWYLKNGFAKKGMAWVYAW